MMPTDEDIRYVREYVKKRLAAERSVLLNVGKAIDKAVEEVVSIACSYNVPAMLFRFSSNRRMRDEIEAVFARLLETVDDYTFTLAACDTEREEAVVAYLRGERYGKTFAERLDGYMGSLEGETELAVAAGLYLGLGVKDIVKRMKENVQSMVQEAAAVSAHVAGLRAEVDKGASGRGRANDAKTGMLSLLRNTVAVGWMYNLRLEAEESGAIGYYVYRGSSYPCALCDSKTGYHASAGDLPPYHPYCCCYFAPIFEL